MDEIGHKKATMEPVKKWKNSRFEGIEEGDYLAETQYYQVVRKKETSVVMRNERGYELEVERGVIEEGMFSANQFNEERKVSRSFLSDLLENAGDSIFTVNFNKQVKEKDVCEEIFVALEQAKVGFGAAGLDELKGLIRGSVKKGIVGEERTLVGHLAHSEPKMGRSQVYDLQIKGPNRVRLVDHRTINWLILKNVKYVVS